jgi:glycosyltransferase involved in cell wall biosynthesis
LKKLRIIYYSPHPTHDIVSEVGYSTHQRESIHAFRQLGHEVLPVVLGGTESSAVNAHISGLSEKAGNISGIKKLLPLWFWNALKDLKLLKHDRKAGKQLEQAIYTFQPDMIYERGEYLQDSGVKMARKHGIKHVLEVNSPVVEEMAAFEGPDLLRFLGHRKERKKLNDTSHVIAVSSSMKEYLQTFYGCKKPIHVAPNAINPEKEKFDPEIVAGIRSKFSNETRIIGFVGSLFPYHGVDGLIEAFAKVVKQEPHTHLMIVGDGSIRAGLATKAESLLPKSTYTFTGKIPHGQVMNYIKAFDVAVMPSSNWYGSPIKIFEYGLTGVPIVAPDKAPLRDVMEHKKHGLLVSDDLEDLKSTLLYMLQNHEAAKEMGTCFREKILQQHTWSAQVSGILSAVLPEA